MRTQEQTIYVHTVYELQKIMTTIILWIKTDSNIKYISIHIYYSGSSTSWVGMSGLIWFGGVLWNINPYG